MAGGTGLNLTGADMVIHYDPWWNPAVEDQATDRAHRIGQKKNVYVIKMIATDTIEEKVLTLQKKKQAVISATIGASDAAVMDTLTIDDFKSLLA
jgi:SNF2 family DNA or RNA helicase